jgi:HEAT repeat protein
MAVRSGTSSTPAGRMPTSGVLKPAAYEVLIELNADVVPYVRDWATFGLASQIDADLTDPDPDTRAEAVCGLARRGGPRAKPAP